MSQQRPDAPTPEEIRTLCLEIQAGWSEQERLSRIVGPKPKSWTVPMVRTTGEPVESVAAKTSTTKDTNRTKRRTH